MNQYIKLGADVSVTTRWQQRTVPPTSGMYEAQNKFVIDSLIASIYSHEEQELPSYILSRVNFFLSKRKDHVGSGEPTAILQSGDFLITSAKYYIFLSAFLSVF